MVDARFGVAREALCPRVLGTTFGCRSKLVPNRNERVVILRYSIEVKESNSGGFQATVDRPGERIAVMGGPSLLGALSLAVDAVVEAETEYEPSLELVTPEMRERFYALVERELGVPRDYWPGHEPPDETVRLRLAYEDAELNAPTDERKTQ